MIHSPPWLDLGYAIRLRRAQASWDGVFYGRSRPKTGKAEGAGLEGWRANLVGRFVSTFQAPMLFVQGEDFQIRQGSASAPAASRWSCGQAWLNTPHRGYRR
jgi:hypothetical protein